MRDRFHSSPDHSDRTVRFGPYEVDLTAGELRRDGRKIRLQEQPFRVLEVLIEQRGKVVTREDLRRRIWPEGTFVDFDHSLNKAVNKLRAALSDKAQNPRYIETLPRRGYRFLAPLEREVEPAPPATPAPRERAAGGDQRLWWGIGGVTAGLLLAGMMGIWSQKPPSPQDLGHVVRAAVGMPTSGELLRWDAEEESFEPFLAGLSADQLAFSADGEWITYVTFPEANIWRSRVDGTDRLQLSFGPPETSRPRFSPDGKHVVYMGRNSQGRWKMFLVSADGGEPELLIPGGGSEADPNFSPDGKQIVFAPFPWESGPEEVAIRILDLETRQVRLVPDSRDLFSPRWSPDGQYLFALRSGGSPEHMLYDFEDRRWIELASFSAGFPNWSRDGRYVYLNRPSIGEISRIEVATSAVERVAPLGDIRIAGFGNGYGLSLAPDDSPIVLRARWRD